MATDQSEAIVEIDDEETGIVDKPWEGSTAAADFVTPSDAGACVRGGCSWCGDDGLGENRGPVALGNVDVELLLAGKFVRDAEAEEGLMIRFGDGIGFQRAYARQSIFVGAFPCFRIHGLSDAFEADARGNADVAPRELVFCERREVSDVAVGVLSVERLRVSQDACECGRCLSFAVLSGGVELVDLKTCGERMIPAECFPVVTDARLESEAVETLVLDFVVRKKSSNFWIGVVFRFDAEAAALLSPALSIHVGEPCFYR